MKKIPLLISVVCITALSAHAQTWSHNDNDTLQPEPLTNLKVPDLQEISTPPGDSLIGLRNDANSNRFGSSVLADELPYADTTPGNQDNMPIAKPGAYWKMPIMVPDPSIDYKLLIKKIPGGKEPLH